MRCRILVMCLFLFSIVLPTSCQQDDPHDKLDDENDIDFYFGADLSYVNQILDKGGVYRDEGDIRNPYAIFADRGTNLVRLRLWHNPEWTMTVYDPAGEKMYNDLSDVANAIEKAKENGMGVLLDFHYADNWADPGKQGIPKAWRSITDADVLQDSVYQYTFKTLDYLNDRGLMPDLVQIGNETNCGMLYTDAPAGFPSCNVCNDGQWVRLGGIIRSGIKAIEDVREHSDVKTRIALHVADPKNVDWWFTNIMGSGNVVDFDIIGFSYYPLWHRTIGVESLSGSVSSFRSKFGKDVMILETAYPWTNETHDNYNNAFGSEAPVAGFPYTVDGQLAMMTKIVQEVVDGGGSGVIYWEPGWISVPALHDQWGTGSSWESNTLFNFDGDALSSFEYMTHDYNKD